MGHGMGQYAREKQAAPHDLGHGRDDVDGTRGAESDAAAQQTRTPVLARHFGLAWACLGSFEPHSGVMMMFGR